MNYPKEKRDELRKYLNEGDTMRLGMLDDIDELESKLEASRSDVPSEFDELCSPYGGIRLEDCFVVNGHKMVDGKLIGILTDKEIPSHWIKRSIDG